MHITTQKFNVHEPSTLKCIYVHAYCTAYTPYLHEVLIPKCFYHYQCHLLTEIKRLLEYFLCKCSVCSIRALSLMLHTLYNIQITYTGEF